MPSAEGPQKCICQICTCGRHRCPHRPGAKLQLGSSGDRPGATVTEYSDRYKDSERFRREPNRRAKDNIGFAGDKLEDATTTRSDYVPQKSERTQAIRNLDSLRHQGDLDMNTVYKSQYEGKQGDRNQPRAVRKDNLGNSSARFSAQPLYKDDYQSWPLERAERVHRPDGIVGSDEPFSSSTTNRATYGDQKPGERQRHARPTTNTRVGGDFDGATTHRDNYQGLPGSKQASFKPTAHYQSSAPFDDYTTQRGDYTEKTGPRTKMQRPLTATKMSGEQLSETTAAADYQPWLTQRPEFRRAAAYVKPSGDIDLNTVTRADYGEARGGERARGARPATSQWYDGEGQESKTTHREDYPGWKAERPTMAGRGHYKPSSGKFDGDTTNRLDYGSANLPGAERAKLVRHAGANLFDSSPLEGATSYRTEFVNHGFGPCPAEGLAGHGSGNDDFRYRTEVGGHHFYMPALPIR